MDHLLLLCLMKHMLLQWGEFILAHLLFYSFLLLFHSSLNWCSLSFRRILCSIISCSNRSIFVAMQISIISHWCKLRVLSILFQELLLYRFLNVYLICSKEKVLIRWLILIWWKLLFRLSSFRISTRWYQVFICTAGTYGGITIISIRNSRRKIGTTEFRNFILD